MSILNLEDAAERVFDKIYEEEDSRVCKDISDEACSNVPQNFFLNAFAIALGKIADALANTKTTLPWLLSSVGAPGWVISMLVPVRESGSMLPQLAIGGWVRRAARRKYFYAAGAVTQALALLGVALAVLLLEGTAAGVTALLGVIAFSLARGFCSVASKDVTGKTVPKTRRGRLNGLSASVAGAGTLGAVALLYVLEASETAYIALVFAAAGLWFCAAALFSCIDEHEGATEGGANGLKQALSRLKLVAEDAPFRTFIIARALMVGTALAAPFIVLMARERSDADLLFFLFAQGLAAVLSGHFWGTVADRSSRMLLMVSGSAAGVLGVALFTIDVFAGSLTRTVWFLPVCFFVLMVIHDGVRLGRKTYVLDLSNEDNRTDYVAVSNTLIGALLLVAGALTSVVQTFGNAAAVLFFSLLAFVACVFVYRLPEVQEQG